MAKSQNKGKKILIPIIAVIVVIAIVVGIVWFYGPAKENSNGNGTVSGSTDTSTQKLPDQILQFEGDVVQALTYNGLLLVSSYDAGLDTASARCDLYNLFDFNKLCSQNIGTGDYNIDLIKDGFYVISRTENKVTLYDKDGNKTLDKDFSKLHDFSRVGAVSRDGGTLLSYDARYCKLYLTDIKMGKSVKLDGTYGELLKAEARDDGFVLTTSEHKAYFVGLNDKSATTLYKGKNITYSGKYYGLGTTDYNFEIIDKNGSTFVPIGTVDECPIGMDQNIFGTVCNQSESNTVKIYDIKNKERREYTLPSAPESLVFAGDNVIAVTVGSGVRRHNVRALNGECIKKIKFEVSTTDDNTLYSKNKLIEDKTEEKDDGETAVKVTANDKTNAVVIDVEALAQNPEFPTGCESVSAVMALKYAGHSVTVSKFVDSYLEKSAEFYIDGDRKVGPDPNEVFVGNPRSAASYG
ncbi:MAG: C39 family peptidase, partial [Oscillospiraceae bacterium]|nr:C39 family peptidase [Candidatus Equicaccousia limihippi]